MPNAKQSIKYFGFVNTQVSSKKFGIYATLVLRALQHQNLAIL
jgi:hypothetical protein